MHNPDYEFMFWTDNNLPCLQNQELFDKSHHVAMMSDVLRYELIYQFGGIYSDTDVECLKSFNDLLDCDFAGMQPGPFICNAVIGGRKSSPNFKQIIDNLPIHFYGGGTNLDMAGPFMFEKEIRKCIEPFRLFPEEAFYPFYCDTKQDFIHKTHEELQTLFPHSYAAHFWEGSWAHGIK
jgi:mannosyltransferase OCH1-like enzyme